MLFWCFVGSKTLLTAAHCAEQDFSSIKVYIGVYTSAWSTSYRYKQEVTAVLMHENFVHKNGNLNNDIALMLLDKGIPQGQYVDFANFKNYNLMAAGDTIYIVGWGAPTVTEVSASNQTVMDNNDCTAKFGGMDFIRKKTFCSTKKSSDASSICEGDSGGPAYFIDSSGKQWLVGIVSYGLDENSCGNPTALISVASYYDWIVKNLVKIKSFAPPIRTK